MKRWIWIILIVIVAGSVGGYSMAHYHENNRQYNQDLASGQLAIKNKNYTAAQNYFSDALLKKRNDKVANDLLHQTRRMVKANSALKGQEFENAKEGYQAVSRDYPRGSKSLKSFGEKQYNLVTKVQKKFKSFSEELKVARDLNTSQMFAQSNAQLDLLFSDSSFKDSYYSTLYDQATKLQGANNNGMANSNNSIYGSDAPTNQGQANNGQGSGTVKQAPNTGGGVEQAPRERPQVPSAPSRSTSSSEPEQSSKMSGSRSSSSTVSQK